MPEMVEGKPEQQGQEVTLGRKIASLIRIIKH